MTDANRVTIERETLERQRFEAWMSDDWEWPKAVERDGNGNYLLATAANGWRVWRAALAAQPAEPVAEVRAKTDAYGGTFVHWRSLPIAGMKLYAAPPAPAAVPPGQFTIGDKVLKRSGSAWSGAVVGTYRTTLTPEGYAVESDAHPGSVQIYPASALAAAGDKP